MQSIPYGCSLCYLTTLSRLIGPTGMTEDEMIEEAMQRALLFPISNVLMFDVGLYLEIIRGEQ